MWIVFAFFTALFEATKDGLCKKSLQNADSFIVAWSWKALTVPFLLPLLLFSPLPGELTFRFWMALCVGGSLNVLATLLYIEAIKSSDLSITLPLLSFTPVFLLVTSPLLVSEYVSMVGGLGVVAIFAGAYILNVSEIKSGYLKPVYALLRERGPRLMLGVAAIWSVAANMDKIGVQETNPFFWCVSIQSFITFFLTLYIFWKRPYAFTDISGNYGHSILVLIGLSSALGLISQMLAINIGLVPYVISIKRTSILFGVIFGGVFFREQKIAPRLMGALIMIAGIFLITLNL